MTGGNANVTRVLHVKRHEQCGATAQKRRVEGKVRESSTTELHLGSPVPSSAFDIAVPLHFLWHSRYRVTCPAPEGGRRHVKKNSLTSRKGEVPLWNWPQEWVGVLLLS